MNNVSLKGEDLLLSAGKYYYLIDALYLGDIQAKYEYLRKDRLEQEIKEKVFPYTDAPFAKIKLSDGLFQIESISKIDFNDLSSNDKNCFSSDTGLILLIEESLFSTVVGICNYDNLVDSKIEEINSEYWTKITSKLPENTIGLILAPGIDSGYEFEGGGIYRINH